MKKVTKITIEWVDGDTWTAHGNHGVITQAGNLEQLVVMIRDAADCMGVEVPGGPDIEIEPVAGGAA